MERDSLTIGRLFGDFRILLILFITFRVILFIAFEPFFLEGIERGVGTGGDRLYHYALTSLADGELYPFADWWSEFPPLWYFTTTTAYVLLGENVSYNAWATILAVIVIISEVGILYLMRQIGTQLHGADTGMALAWIYALLVLPVIFMWWNFDTLVTLFALWALRSLLQSKRMSTSALIAIGALTKFIPLLLFGAIIRFLKPRVAIQVIGTTVILFAIAYVPLFITNAEFATISLTSQFNKPSYQTVWALIDGNYTTGNFGTVESHLTAEGVNDDLFERNDAVIPSWIRLGLAGVIGLFVFLRTRRTDALGVVAFFGITVTIFYLQSQGFSPQWLTLIIPLILLVYPTRNSVYIVAILSLLAFIEYPFLFIRTGETGGEILPDSSLYMPWVVVILLRSVILVGVAVAFYQRLRQHPNPDLALKDLQ